ncbi:hypothetical protein [Ottowia thiooxydans]|uniref:hypothetical protein n=1 Tax=Ottowia thiooxydans TaxID=219182 RepID=UPI00041ED1E1|nr:hypothetical protein [Ottowia thiooxydans]
MQAKTIALATVLAASFAGSAFAAQPVSGEGPQFSLFQDGVVTSSLSRAEVKNQALIMPPVAGDRPLMQFNANATSTTSRAEVREQTREAIALGYRVKSGEMR